MRSVTVLGLGPMGQASRDAGVEAGALESLRRHVDAAVDAGYGHDDLSRVVAMQ
jgi:hypothetical protein